MANVYMVVTGEGTLEVGTVAEVNKALGIRTTKKAIVSGQVEGVTLVEDVQDEVLTDTHEEEVAIHTVEQAPESTEEVVEEATEVAEDSVEEDTVEEEEESTEEPTATEEVEEEEDSEDLVYPEVGDYEDSADLKKFYKKLSVEQLEEWVELEGLEVIATDSQPIYRMRLCMAILYKHFPKAESKPKSKRKYTQSTEELVQMAIDHDVEIKDDKGNEQILRMYAIMALRNAGVLD